MGCKTKYIPVVRQGGPLCYRRLFSQRLPGGVGCTTLSAMTGQDK
jgi:hypothetical protein